jgi:hypothetical protein
MMRFCISAIATLALGGLAAGCGAAANGNGARCSDPSCLSGPNADATPILIPELHVEITPPMDSAFVVTQELNVPIGPAPFLTLHLPEPVAIALAIKDPQGSLIDSSVSLRNTESIPGREQTVRTEFRSSALKSQALSILPGRYQALISPLDPNRPGLETTYVVRPPTGEIVTKEFQLKPPRVLSGTVASSLSSDHPFEGVTVRAFSASSGLASTVAKTGPLGAYAILLPDTEDDAFVLIATPPAEDAPAWSYQETITVPEGGRKKNIGLEPTSPDIQGRATIQIGGTGTGFEPVADARVTLTASRSAGLTTRTFSVNGTTDGDGFVIVRDAGGVRELELLKALYLVEIEPPASSPYARQTTTLDLTKLGPTYTYVEQIPLELKVKVGGTIRSDLGRPVPLASIEIQPLIGRSRAVEARTDAIGSFETALEPGTYLLVVSPRETTDTHEFPPVAVVSIEVPFDVKHFSLPPITLPKSALIRGTLTGAEQALPIPDAKIEFFYDLGAAVVSLGATRSDPNGAFMILLPASMAL